MSTKDFISSNKHRPVCHNPSDSEYNNLNLKSGHGCPVTNFAKNNVASDNKKRAYGYTDDYGIGPSQSESQTILGSWNSFGKELCSAATPFPSHYDKYNMNKKEKSIGVTSTTIALHISAYENAIPTSEVCPKIMAKRIKQPNHWKFFETPRQQEEGTTVPEVAQYRASQRLLNFNERAQEGGSSGIETSEGGETLTSQPPSEQSNPSWGFKAPEMPPHTMLSSLPPEAFMSPAARAMRERQVLLRQMFGPVVERTPHSSNILSSTSQNVITNTSVDFSSDAASSSSEATSHNSGYPPQEENGDDSWEITRDLSKNNLFSLVFNGRERIATTIAPLPDKITVPKTTGTHLRVFSSVAVKDVKQARNDDMVPWGGKPVTANYVIQNHDGIFRATETRNKNVQTQAQCYSAKTSKTGKVFKKTIFSATTPSSRAPAEGTLIVILYEIADVVEPCLRRPEPNEVADTINPLEKFANEFQKAASAFQKQLKSATATLHQQLPNVPIPEFRFPATSATIPAPSIQRSFDQNTPDIRHNNFDAFDADFDNNFDPSGPSDVFHTDNTSNNVQPFQSSVGNGDNNSNNGNEIRQPPEKRRRLDGKVLVTNFTYALNNKLNPVMIVVPHDQNNVYHYSKSSGSKNNEYFTCMGCTRSKSTAKGAAILEDGNLWVGPDHGCVPVTMENHLKEQEDRKCRLMVAEGVKPRTAHDIFFKRTADMDIDIGEYNKYRRQYSRWRGAYYPSCVGGKIAPEFHYLYPPQKGKRWLLFEDKQVTGFASDLQLRIMAEADVLQLDASFGNAPVGYSQYLSIHALVGENGQEWQPVFMAVMNGKNEDLYDRIFDEIKKYWEENEITPTFKRILSDYESALQNALIKFTDPEKVWGCSFHYSQALLRSVGRLHLMNYYSVFEKRDYPEKWLPIRTWIRSIMALPLLPIEERDFIWEKVLRNPPAAPEGEQTWPVLEMQSFVEYVENTWFTKPGNSWCFFNGGRVKNINRSEGWHSVIAKLYDRKPKYNVFIHDMQLLFSKAEKRLEALKRGEKAREQEKKYKILVDRIQAYEYELVESLQSELTEEQRIKTDLRHLRRVQYLLHDIRNKSGSTNKSKKNAAVKSRAEDSAIWNGDLGVGRPQISQENEPVETQGEYEMHEEVEGQECDDGNDLIGAFMFDDFDVEDIEHEVTAVFEEAERSFLTEFGDLSAWDPDNSYPPEVAATSTDEGICIVPHRPEDRAVVDREVEFVPPSLRELESILLKLGLDPALAVNSPLLNLAAAKVDEHTPFIKRNVDGDGNCCWRAVSLLFTGTEEYYWEIREAAFVELKEYADFLHGIKDQKVQAEYAIKYLELGCLTKGGVDKDYWGGTTELLGLANLLLINIIVLNPSDSNNQPFFTRCSPLGLRCAHGFPSIFLFTTPGHYQAIVGIKTPESL